MDTQEKYTVHILSFLEEREYIAPARLEAKVGAPTGTFNNARQGRLIPARWIFPILFELAKCGIKDIYGARLTADEETYCIFAQKWVRNGETVEEEKGIFVHEMYFYKGIYTNYADL
jgi:hypothetical protein